MTRLRVLIGAVLVQLGCGSDGEPPADPFTCIEAWPVDADKPATASLAVTPAVAWTRAFGEFETPPIGAPQLITVSGTQIVTPLRDRVVAFDRATGVRTWTAQPVSLEGTVSYVHSSPAADEDGILYGVARDAYAIDATGELRWSSPIEVVIQSGGEFHSVYRPPVVLGPDGLMFVLGDQRLHALRTDGGGELWQAAGAYVFAGAGPVLVGDSEVRSASDGKLRGHVRSSRGTRLHVLALAGYGFVGWHSDPEVLEAVNPCDEVLWSLPAGSSSFLAVAGIGPSGVTYAHRVPREGTTDTSTLLAISAEGVVRAAATVGGTVIAIGADASVYLQVCSKQPAEIVAIGPALEPLWRLAIEGTCPMAAVLAEGGGLYLLNTLGAQYRLIAVQTTSPGPARAQDARATRWLRP